MKFLSVLLLSYVACLPQVSDAKPAAGKIYKGAATFYVKPEYVEAFKIEVGRIIGPTRREADNIAYEAFQLIDDKGKPTRIFQFHELWKTKDSMLVKHKENTRHMKEFFGKIKIGDADSWVEKFEISGSDVEQLK